MTERVKKSIATCSSREEHVPFRMQLRDRQSSCQGHALDIPLMTASMPDRHRRSLHRAQRDCDEQGSHYLRLLGACTDQPKSAILSSPCMPSSRFSGLMSRWITCFAWQYSSARASEAMYLQRSTPDIIFALAASQRACQLCPRGPHTYLDRYADVVNMSSDAQ